MDDEQLPDGSQPPDPQEQPAPTVNEAVLKPLSEIRNLLQSLRETPGYTRNDAGQQRDDRGLHRPPGSHDFAARKVR
jgi:hypothetical protein